MPDISETLAPKSDQLDNIDLRGAGPRVFTVTQVDVHFGSDQPIALHLAEFDRPWKPGKNMRRVLAECWGRESDDWVGRQVELYADEKVKFGNETPGGTRISRLSHIDGPKSAAILQGQGKPGLWKVNPLPAITPAPKPEPLTDDAIACCTDVALLGDWWRQHPDQRAAIEARVAEVKADAGAES